MRIGLLSLLLFASGCAHSVHLYNVNDSSSYAGKLIEATGEQFTVLGFVSDTSYVNRTFRQLADQCKEGRVEGINTRYSTSLGFLSWTNKVYMRGYYLASAKK